MPESMANVLHDRSAVVSSFTIIKGSMIEETYAALRDWDFGASSKENLAKIKATNSIGAKSANWLRDVCKVLHRRFDPNGRDRGLTLLAQRGCPLEVWKPLLLWHMTRDEFLLRDFLVNWLFVQFEQGALQIRSDEVVAYLNQLHKSGSIAEAWSKSTVERVASSLLRMAVDFNLMRGSSSRRFNSFHLPEASFLYLLHAMREVQPNARALVESKDWHMFLMTETLVERELFRLHQFRRLLYEVAGSLAQLTLPWTSAEEFAKEIAL
jgi:hypothetical protein